MVSKVQAKFKVTENTNYLRKYLKFVIEYLYFVLLITGRKFGSPMSVLPTGTHSYTFSDNCTHLNDSTFICIQVTLSESVSKWKMGFYG